MEYQQVAQLSQRNRAMLYVIKCSLSHSRSLKMVPFESFATVSYSHSIITMALSCTGRKSRFLPSDAMHKRGLCRYAVSVCVCVCVSRSWIMSKRINISSNFFHHRVPHHSGFSVSNGIAIFRREPP